MKLAVLASHNGSALDAIYNAIFAGELQNLELSLVISNNSDAKVLQKAAAYGIPLKYIKGTSKNPPLK
ncbi:MAG: hypothetical protein FAF04_06215 [Epsilonproteobacteria bacterium]|nr:hypothetical protein [Campylobacterota bacterium]